MRPVSCLFRLVIFIVIGSFFQQTKSLYAEEIERFEHYTTDEGLSQNTITSIHCDSKGFMWFGTYNGLNRFDGYHFKVFQNTVNNPGIFTNNRVISIWEDQQQFLWFETYDGYYHSYNPVKEKFSTLPKYLQSAEEKYSRMNCFYQHAPDEIWLGSSNSGVYRLTFDSIGHEYNSEQFLSRGQYAISNNNIRFIIADRDSTLYIGAKNGLNILENENIRSKAYYFQHFFSDLHFTCGVAVNNEVWMGTENSGLVVYNLDTKSFYVFNKENSPLTCNHIDVMKVTSDGNIIIGSSNLFIYQPIQKRWLTIQYDGEKIDKIFEDHTGLLWVITGKFGVQQVNQKTGENKHFDLSPANYKFLSDRQRPYFYEDSNNNLWICLHGAGLARYMRERDDFQFYRNNPNDLKSISSNTVMCMTEDKHGSLWIGVGLEGGINKVIFKNPAFTSIQYNQHFDDYTENIVRALCEDSNHNIWIASKGGSLKLYNQDLQEMKPGIRFPFEPVHGLVYNLYSIFQDSRGYVWLGSKGAGIAVSKKPVNLHTTNYSQIAFHRYYKVEGDSGSLCNNNIYCIEEDAQGRIWIGTYGGGLSVCHATDVARLRFNNISTGNSNLSNDMVRDLMFDSDHNLWIATTFGLNRLGAKNIETNHFSFECFYHDPENTNSLSYNDVVHIFEDSKKNLWFGTFGGGVNLMTSENLFLHFSSVNGLCNNEVFGISEDNEGYMWFSTGNGLS
ncbi:MAG: hybrid sensor histidine kinase/response regulator, partial [Prolixibacteraceae bacterium]|nr:hybrid sensor histidine kinase/response regulator [Prolixibacteraceae bacterium]